MCSIILKCSWIVFKLFASVDVALLSSGFFNLGKRHGAGGGGSACFYSEDNVNRQWFVRKSKLSHISENSLSGLHQHYTKVMQTAIYTR